ncbi:adenylate kinase [Vagococcus xieshaowenii]|uniref:Adenylate kinase n=1 Tax=Vagococcus xieshaowenii TaxID=2562451 RepID=A0AAJ5JM17_9ENTE|nr:adenylate kinase [Vagococcus xieshaowenii]QCA28109.1 adenylate kinase [Vagococcus xieshaowenii]TFZ40152.1 adenylate kinase [Vagococcus xieshaowenii]
MITIITGETHVGKTALAQRLLEIEQIPYLSIDHLKMGLIRTKQTALTPMSSDESLTEYLWPIVAEMIKTAIENQQSLIVEGCYVPENWKTYFSKAYLKEIRYLCLIFSEAYIRQSFEEIVKYSSVIERRLDDGWLTSENLIKGNRHLLEQCQRNKLPYVLIDQVYDQDELLKSIQKQDKH